MNDFRVVLVQPAIVHRTGDVFGNIPFMPTGITYLAGYVRQQGFSVRIVDGFGEAPTRSFPFVPERTRPPPKRQLAVSGGRLPVLNGRTIPVQELPATLTSDALTGTGLTPDEVVQRLEGEPVIGIAVHASMSHAMALAIAKRARAAFPNSTLVAGGHHASAVHGELLAAGFDYVILGEGEKPFVALLHWLRGGAGDLATIDGIAFGDHARPQVEFDKNLDQFGHAAHDLLPLQGYWRLGMSHAPVRGPYLAITTSRGCPYGCRFCTTPKMLGRRWRTRSAKHIVDEMEEAQQSFGVSDFIIQDEIFVVRKDAALAFADEVRARGLKVRIYLPSGVKVEALDREIFTRLRETGLQYISFAPESGSPRVLKRMNKPLNLRHLYDVVESGHQLGVRMGAFFIIGFEDEDDADRVQTRRLIGELIRRGVDDVSLFIWSPLPGADAFEYESGWTEYHQLNWSPSWRRNYAVYARFRRSMLLYWLACRLRYRPFGVMRSGINVVTRRFELKSEMALLRALKSSMARLQPTP